MNITKACWYLKTWIFKFEYGGVGARSYIGRPVFIQRKKNLYIGSHVRIYPGLRAELTLPSAAIEIGDNVSVGQNFHVVSYDETLRIGKNTTISGNVFVSDVSHAYTALGLSVLEQNMIRKHTEIGENCFLGYGAVILPGTTLGRQCIVGANAVVKGIFPDYCVIAGNPAKVIKRFNMRTEKWEKAVRTDE